MFRHGLATIPAVLFACAAAQAQDVTLKGVSSFPEGTLFSSKFEAFVERMIKDFEKDLTAEECGFLLEQVRGFHDREKLIDRKEK